MENDTELLEILRYLLEEEGHTVFTAASGPEALASISSQSIDLVVMDTAQVGLEVARSLRSFEGTASVLIVVHTGSPEAAVRIAFDDYDAYLQKVDDSAVFVRLISEILGAKARTSPIALDGAAVGAPGEH